MARLKLKPGVTYGMVGDVVARMAGEAQAGNSLNGSDLLEEFEDLLDISSEGFAGMAVNEFSPSSLPTVETRSFFVNFHFDKTIEHEGTQVRVINVAIPDFNDKLTSIARQGELLELGSDNQENEELNQSLADLSEVAKEAFGFIVICGCAG